MKYLTIVLSVIVFFLIAKIYSLNESVSQLKISVEKSALEFYEVEYQLVNATLAKGIYSCPTEKVSYINCQPGGGPQSMAELPDKADASFFKQKYGFIPSPKKVFYCQSKEFIEWARVHCKFGVAS